MGGRRSASGTPRSFAAARRRRAAGAAPLQRLRPLGRARDDRPARALAEPGERVGLELELGADPGVERQLGQRHREPPSDTSCAARQHGRRAPEEVDERGLGRRSRAPAAARPGRRARAPGTRSRRARPGRRRPAGRRRPPARRPGRCGRPRRRPRSRRPASAGSRARPSRCRARRCRRRPGFRAPRTRAPCPRSPRRAPRRSRASRGSEVEAVRDRQRPSAGARNVPRARRPRAAPAARGRARGAPRAVERDRQAAQRRP